MPHTSWNDETLNTVFSALSHPHRRQILTTIHDTPPENTGAFHPQELINDRETTGQPLVELHHSHLPKLERAGFIQWNRDSNAVRKGPHFEQIQPLLNLFETHDDELPYDFP